MRAASALNGPLTTIFDIASRPLLALAPVWALAIFSLAAGGALVWLFGGISDQRSIRAVRERIRGNLLGIYVYRHDIGVILRLQAKVAVDAVISMRHMLVPLLVAAVPVVLLMAQL